MKKLFPLAVALAFFAASNVNAKETVGDIQDFVSSPQSTPRIVELDGIYKTQRSETEVVPVGVYENAGWVNRLEDSIIFEKGEPMAVQFQRNGDVMVSILKGPGDVTPSVFILTKDEFLDAGLTFVREGDVITLSQNFSPFADTQVGSRHRGGHAHYRHHGRGHGRRYVHTIGGRYSASGCLGWVEAQVGWNIPGGVGGASNFAHKLVQVKHWHRSDCRRPSSGDVGSWSGMHVAMWNGSCWQYDIGCGPPGSGYGSLYYCASR
jgi:hypothetical protein